jgi:hypothetical protein
MSKKNRAQATKSSAKKRPTERIVRTLLGPLPESLGLRGQMDIIEADDDAAKYVIDDQILDCIINAVGRPLKGGRQELLHDLLNCLVRYRVAADSGQRG